MEGGQKRVTKAICLWGSSAGVSSPSPPYFSLPCFHSWVSSLCHWTLQVKYCSQCWTHRARWHWQHDCQPHTFSKHTHIDTLPQNTCHLCLPPYSQFYRLQYLEKKGHYGLYLYLCFCVSLCVHPPEKGELLSNWVTGSNALTLTCFQ